ncbi:site-specific integrase [Oceanobacillus arenosus]|uniref:Site-specific integrase n=1 Tax=Oceanobacillus arenosus TaxID=1229153 RepID=A0A3D8PNB6_9BACI|nr:site-specific integrase [Oceanobacillus arenosus]RDW17596.1 site-specific integrase [Oceanobacillus arenosus]
MPVYKDKERGTYYFITRVNGKQIKRRGFKSSGEAKRAEAQAILDADELDLEDPTFEFMANEYLDWYKKRRKESSYNKISGITNNHLIPFFGKKKLNNIKNRDITKFHDKLIDDKKAVASMKIIHVVLSAIFNYAIKQEYTTKNPARIVGNVEGKPKKHMDYWILDEFKKFINEVDEFIYYVFFMTLYYSGMRKGEALALTWGDVDFDNNNINVDKTNYNLKVTSTKNEVVRKIEMPKFVMRLLSQLNAQCETEPKLTYNVFGEFHKPLPTSTIDRRLAKYIKASGVKTIRIHDFRHSHASYLINKGVIISVISKRLGHTNVATTLNTYSHLYPSTESEAVKDMENDFMTAEIIEFKAK